MSLSRPVLLAILVSSSALISVSAQIVSTHTGSKSAATTEPAAKSTSVPDPAARSIINDLDTLVQKRFETIVRFRGMSRVLLSASDEQVHHPDMIHADKPDEQRLLTEVKTLKRPYEVCFFHYKPLPKTLKPNPLGRVMGYPPAARYSSTPVLASLTAEPPPAAFRAGLDINGTRASQQAAYREWANGMKTHRDELKQILVTQIPDLERGENISTLYRNDWYMETRPLTAHSAECLTCHPNVQKGATMAAMVYLVKKDIPWKPSRPSRVWGDFANRY